MKRLLIIGLLGLGLCGGAQGQGQTSASYANPLGGDITTSSTNCSVPKACVWQKVPPSSTTVTVTVANGPIGSFSGTLNFEQSNDGINFVAASPASTTTTGTFSFSLAAYTDFRVRASAFASGDASVNIQANIGGGSGSGGGGSAGAFSSITTGVNTSATMTCGTGCTLTTSGTGVNSATAIGGVAATGSAPPGAGYLPTSLSSSTFSWQLAPSSPVSSQSAIYLSPSCPNPNSGTCYYTNADTHSFLDATFTNGSTTVTTAGEVTFQCPGSSYPCSSGGDVGKTIFGFVSCTTSLISNVTAGLGATATTITTVNSVTSVTVSIAATQSTTGASGCAAYGTLDDTGTALADAAAQAANTCPAVIFPALNLMWGAQHFITAPTKCTRSPEDLGLSAVAGWGYNVGGQGKGVTHIYIPPWFPVSSCVAGTGIACFGGNITGSWWHDFTFTGLGNSRTGTTSNKAMFEPGCYALVERMGFVNFGATDGALVGVYMNNGGSCLYGPMVMQDTTIDGWGNQSYACGTGGGRLYATRTSFQDSNSTIGSSLSIANSGCYYVSNGHNFYGGSPGSPAAQKYIYITANNTQFIRNDSCGTNGSTTVNYCVWVQGSAPTIVNLSGNSFGVGNATAGIAVFVNTNGGTVHLSGNFLTGGTVGGNSLFSNAGGVVFDDCGNVMTGAVSLTGPLFGSCSITGTSLVAGNVGLTSGWSTSTVSSVGVSSESHHGVFTITAAGTPTANPTITLTFPTPFWVAPAFCSFSQTAGTLGVLTVPLNSASALSATSVLFTLSGTPVATQTYTFAHRCE